MAHNAQKAEGRRQKAEGDGRSPVTPHSAFRIPHCLSGFTLGEVLLVVVILAILAAVAIPNYRRSVERGYWRQAQDLLMAIYSGERVYFFRENAYKGGLGPASTMEDWRTIDIDNPNLGATPQVEFSVTASGTGPTATFTATATRKGGGPCDTKTLTIDQARTFIPDANTTVCWTGCGCE